ncbi:MAG: hypothetical protein KAS32_23770 [Candidatus Peribacteraceae bacterium]|nr:hypothetical protein [Candidatus Peribacteraceae bacterium]
MAEGEVDFAPVILQNLIYNEEYTRKVFPFLSESFFQDRVSKVLFVVIHEFITEYQDRPTTEAITVQLGDAKLDESTFDDAMLLLKSFEPDNTKLDWLVDKTEEWCTDSFVFNKLMESIAIANGEIPDKSRNVIPELLREALGFSFDSNVGHDYFEMAKEQFDYYHNEDIRIPFDIEIMNKITRGGVLPKTLNIVLAGINVGKTTWLVHIASQWLKAGKNVLYITAEVAEEVIRERIDVNLMQKTSSSIYAMERHLYLNQVNTIQKKTDGKLFVKEYPAGASHTGHYRHLLNELAIKKRFVPDLIIVDYLGELSSSRLPASAKSNTNLYYTEIARELRALGKEYDVPVWSAAQLTRGGQDNKDPGISDTGDAIGIPKVADFMVYYGQPDELIERKQAYGKIIKNRYNNRNKIVRFMIGLDNDMQSFYDTDQMPEHQQEEQRIITATATTGGMKQAPAEVTKKWRF